MRYIAPHKLKIMMAAFLGTGAMGIFMGLRFASFEVTMLGTINLCLGGVVGWLLLTQGPRPRDSRKRSHK